MSEKGILMNGAMVRAIMAGKKTQTRRIMRNQPRNGIRKTPFYQSGLEDLHGYQVKLQYQPGDRLYVRETWVQLWKLDDYDHIIEGTEKYYYRADGRNPTQFGFFMKRNGDRDMERESPPWRPSLHMPKSAARIWLEVVRVWPEIVEDISEEDARAEGFDSKKYFLDTMVKIYGDCLKKWCWATEFKRIEVGK